MPYTVSYIPCHVSCATYRGKLWHLARVTLVLLRTKPERERERAREQEPGNEASKRSEKEARAEIRRSGATRALLKMEKWRRGRMGSKMERKAKSSRKFLKARKFRKKRRKPGKSKKSRKLRYKSGKSKRKRTKHRAIPKGSSEQRSHCFEPRLITKSNTLSVARRRAAIGSNAALAATLGVLPLFTATHLVGLDPSPLPTPFSPSLFLLRAVLAGRILRVFPTRFARAW